MESIVRCKNQIFRNKRNDTPLCVKSGGICSQCITDEGNKACSGFVPIRIFIITVVEKNAAVPKEEKVLVTAE